MNSRHPPPGSPNDPLFNRRANPGYLNRYLEKDAPKKETVEEQLDRLRRFGGASPGRGPNGGAGKGPASEQQGLVEVMTFSLPDSVMPAAQLPHAGMLPRLAATALDALVFVPLSLLVLFVAHFSKWTTLPALLLIGLGGLVYVGYSLLQDGRTWGRKMMKIRVVRESFAPLRPVDVLLRGAGDALFLLPNVMTLFLFIALLPGGYVEKMSFGEYLDFLHSSLDRVAGILWFLAQVWFWSEYIACVFDHRRRGLQDMLAGTVVVKG